MEVIPLYPLLLPTVSSTEDFRHARSAKAQAVRGTDSRSRGRKLYAFGVFGFSSIGATGRTSEAFPKRLASLLSDKWNASRSYSETRGWLRCRVSFALLSRGANVLCLRGTRARNRPIESHFPAVALSEARPQGAVLVSVQKTKRLINAMILRNCMETVTNPYQPFFTASMIYCTTRLFSHLLSCFHHLISRCLCHVCHHPFILSSSFVTLRWLPYLPFCVLSLCFVQFVDQ